MTERIEVLKTFKIYINGKFPRTESGRYYVPENPKRQGLGNICLCSRKDVRNAVVAARKAQESWAVRSAYNNSQILYRIAENLESRKSEFVELVVKEEAISSNKASAIVESSIDRLIYFAGWSDKFQQLFSSVNPVASSHFNFSMAEPTGVVTSICGKGVMFKGLVSAVAATICGGNTIVILANENGPLSAISFAEVLQHSDVPAGVVNILTGKSAELESHMASHMDVNALLLLGYSTKEAIQLEALATENLKRVRSWSAEKVNSDEVENPYSIQDFLETKTTWHPVEQIGGATAGY
ncbi:MAG: acyl-CoA reductase-like NAD-dependent aldehyde dehydrogenase [Vicingaceae bacterium]|jgi:acyl-CoA reductase-like NAD-dependent aldehyde dehydrogenase